VHPVRGTAVVRVLASRADVTACSCVAAVTTRRQAWRTSRTGTARARRSARCTSPRCCTSTVPPGVSLVPAALFRHPLPPSSCSHRHRVVAVVRSSSLLVDRRRAGVPVCCLRLYRWLVLTVPMARADCADGSC
jgi:hypothetical protein